MALRRPPETTARRAADVMSERFDEETVVLEPSSDRYVRLNANGSRLWDRLETPMTLSGLADVLVTDWGLDAAQAQADVDAFVAFLAERGMIELIPPA